MRIFFVGQGRTRVFGETIITAGMFEPNAGSAVTDLETRARFDDDEVVINASKIFNSNGNHAGYF